MKDGLYSNAQINSLLQEYFDFNISYLNLLKDFNIK